MSVARLMFLDIRRSEGYIIGIECDICSIHRWWGCVGKRSYVIFGKNANLTALSQEVSDVYGCLWLYTYNWDIKILRSLHGIFITALARGEIILRNYWGFSFVTFRENLLLSGAKNCFSHFAKMITETLNYFFACLSGLLGLLLWRQISAKIIHRLFFQRLLYWLTVLYSVWELHDSRLDPVYTLDFENKNLVWKIKENLATVYSWYIYNEVVNICK